MNVLAMCDDDYTLSDKEKEFQLYLWDKYMTNQK